MPSARERWPFFVRPAPNLVTVIALSPAGALLSPSVDFQTIQESTRPTIEIHSVHGRAAPISTDAWLLVGTMSAKPQGHKFESG